MKFTDDDLKRIKDKTVGQPEMVELWCIDLEALIARLEAAEEVARHHAGYLNCKAVIAWRQSKGEEKARKSSPSAQEK